MSCFASLQIALAGCLAAAAFAPAGRAAPVPDEFDVPPELELTVVAAENLVSSPVAIAFDEQGRMFVAEMIDYPYENTKRLGRVALLTDTDGDGRYDHRTTFADNLSWPSGIACSKGGILLAATPDLLYLKDTDGDGRADVRRVLFTGFGQTRPTPFPDMVVNGFAWGPDNRLYGATSINFGRVVPGDDRAAEPIDLTGLDFSIDPLTFDLRPESGGSQFGVSFDAYGRRFVCNAGYPSMVMYDLRYAVRNPHYELPKVLGRLFVEGAESDVFRISPEETWRILRTQSRVSGKTPGPIENGKASGRVTSAAGVTIYRGGALPAQFNGNLFLAEPAGNVVLRKLLAPRGVGFAARRAPEERQKEVVRSRDTRFRPVNFANGPDGALYIVDMHRDLIEDPEAIPEEIRRQLGINPQAGRMTGRILRLAAKGQGPVRQPVMAGLGARELVTRLESPNGWIRDTAARLLYEGQDRSAVAGLEGLAAGRGPAYVRIQALNTLAGLQALSLAHVRAALADREPEVRESGVRLAEPFVRARAPRAASDEDRRALRRAVLLLAGDPAPRVRYQVMFTAGEMPPDDDVNEALYRGMSGDVGDEWIVPAALSSVNDNAFALLRRAVGDASLTRTTAGIAVIGQIAGIVGARSRPGEVPAAIDLLAGTTPETAQFSFVVAFEAGLRRANASLREVDRLGRLSSVFAAAAGLAANAKANEDARVTAIRLAAQDAGAADGLFYRLLTPAESRRIQIATLEALALRQPASLADALLARWGSFTPPVRQEALKIIIAKPERMLALLAAIRDQKVRRSDLSASQIQFLKNHPDPRVGDAARAVFHATIGNRQQVIDRYLGALSLKTDVKHGRDVFRAVCSACHRMEGEGFDLGPDLKGVRQHGKEGILIDIFDPNRKVDPSYLLYEVITNNDEVLMGAIANETPVSITLKQPHGQQSLIMRAQIKKMTAYPQSMMPEGLENALQPQDVADLIEYLLSAE